MEPDTGISTGPMPGVFTAGKAWLLTWEGPNGQRAQTTVAIGDPKTPSPPDSIKHPAQETSRVEIAPEEHLARVSHAHVPM